MNIETAYSRAIVLFILLKYSSTKNYFSTGERIVINQERAKSMENETAIEYDCPLPNPERFIYSKAMENKINFVKSKVENEPEVLVRILKEIQEIL